MIVEHHDQLVEQNQHLLEENARLHQQLDQAEARERQLRAEYVSLGITLQEALERMRSHVTRH